MKRTGRLNRQLSFREGEVGKVRSCDTTEQRVVILLKRTGKSRRLPNICKASIPSSKPNFAIWALKSRRRTTKMGSRKAPELLFVVVCSLCWGPAIGAQGTLRVGAARVDITPADPAHPPSGKYAHEKLYVRAIVLDNGSARAALIAADQGRPLRFSLAAGLQTDRR